MEIKEIHSKLNKQCPSNFRINEIIRFAYPFRRVKIKATVNKSPEKSIQQVYSVFLRTINAGYNTDSKIINFLGLHKEDFILKELYFLRERGFADLVSGCWIVTEQGNEFIKNNSILKILEEEEFEFLIDGVNNDIIPIEFRTYQVNQDINKLNNQITFTYKDSKLIEGKNEQISEVYNHQYKGKSYIVDYDKNNIIFDSKDKEFKEYYIIEYIPVKEKEDELEPFIEVRNIKDISKDKRITKILLDQYPSVIYQLTTSERNALETALKSNLEEDKKFIKKFETPKKLKLKTQTLSVWETQAKFKEALETAKYRLLIESPWVKKATLNYIELIKKALKRGVKIYVLYGIEENDEHYRKAEKELMIILI